MRTFADDMLRARGESQVNENVVTKASSVVAPTITARSSEPAKNKGFFGSVLSGDLLDIRSSEQGAEEATIVSERRTKNWSFSKAVSSGVAAWWKDTVEEVRAGSQLGNPTQPPQHTAGVQAATKNTDTRALADRLLGVLRPPQTPTRSPKPTIVPDATPTWTHKTETPAPILARPTIRASAPMAQSPQPHIEPPVTEPSLFRSSSAPIRMPRAPAAEVPAPTIAERALPEHQTTIEEELPSGSAQFALRVRDAAMRRREYEAQNTPGKRSSSFIVYLGLATAGVFFFALLGGVGYIISIKNAVVPQAPTSGITVLFAVSENIAVPLIPSRGELLVDLTKRMLATTGEQNAFVRFYFVDPTTETELPPRAFLDILDFRAPGSMLRTIEDSMMFGTYIEGQNAPFLVLKVKNFEDALGGMLLFEPSINSDLAPLFGENLERVGQKGAFRDEVVRGIDARSLYDDFGNMVLIYAFLDRETLVVTTSYTALGALAGVLK